MHTESHSLAAPAENRPRSVPDVIDELRTLGEDLSPQLGCDPMPPFDLCPLARAIQHIYAAASELIEFEKTMRGFAPLNLPSEGSPAPRT